MYRMKTHVNTNGQYATPPFPVRADPPNMRRTWH